MIATAATRVAMVKTSVEYSALQHETRGTKLRLCMLLLLSFSLLWTVVLHPNILIVLSPWWTRSENNEVETRKGAFNYRDVSATLLCILEGSVRLKSPTGHTIQATQVHALLRWLPMRQVRRPIELERQRSRRWTARSNCHRQIARESSRNR